MTLSLPLILAAENPLVHVVDHYQFHLGPIPVTNHMILMCVAAVAMLLVFPPLTRAYRDGKHVPTGTRNLFEALLVFVRDDIGQPAMGHHSLAYLPYLWTLFFFILFNNLMGLIPLLDLTHLFHNLGLRHPLGGTPTGNIYVTGTLAIVAFVVIQISGIKANGLGNYVKHFLGGAPVYMAPIMIPVEIMGMFIKPFALAIRLFANMTAGHVLLAVLVGFVGAGYALKGPVGGVGIGIVVVAASVAIMCLEVFVAFLQAYIFTFLTALFIGLLVVHQHDEEHAEHAEGTDLDPSHREGHGHHMRPDDHTPDKIRQAAAHMAG